MTSNYPIHDPAEIAKLPDGWYQVRGPECRDYVPSAVYKRGDEWYDGNAERISRVGGIAYRLVPEDQYELIRTQLEGHFSDMKAQRDELAGLLRDLAEITDEKAWSAFALAELLEEWLPKGRAALAKLDPTNDMGIELKEG